jgi:hypothetical protein
VHEDDKCQWWSWPKVVFEPNIPSRPGTRSGSRRSFNGRGGTGRGRVSGEKINEEGVHMELDTYNYNLGGRARDTRKRLIVFDQYRGIGGSAPR